MASKIKTLQEEREKLIVDIRSVVAKDDLSSDEQASVITMKERYKSAGDELEEAKRDDSFRSETEAFLAEQARAQEADPTGDPSGEIAAAAAAAPAGNSRASVIDGMRIYTRDGQRNAEVGRMLRDNPIHFNDNVERDRAERMFAKNPQERELLAYLQMGSAKRNVIMGTDAQGGFLVPPNTDFYSMLTQKMEAYMGVKECMTTVTTDTLAEAAKPYSAENVRKATVIGEVAAVTERSTPVFAQTKFNPRIIATDRYGVSWAAMRSAGINLPQYLAMILGEQLARGYHAYYITGNGAAGTPEPNGLTTAVTRNGETGGGPDIRWDLSDNQLSVDAEPASRGYGLARLLPGVQHAVNIAYRKGMGAAVVMADELLLALRIAISSTGQRLYPELDMPTIDGSRTWGGMKLIVDPNLPTYGDTAADESKMLYVGDFQRFWELEVSGFIFIDDPYSGSGNLTHRYRLAAAMDCDVIDTDAIAFFQVTTHA